MEKRKISNRISTAVLILTIAVCSLNVMNVSAGYSEIVADSMSPKDSLDSAKWNIPNDDITVKEGKILFSEDSTSDTRLITTAAIKVSEYNDVLMNLDCIMSLKSLPESQRFMIALALDTTESYDGEGDSLEIYFENRDGLKVGIQAYDEGGETITITEPQNCGISLGQSMKVNVNVSTDMILEVRINDKVICNQTSPINLEGRVGFLQSGACEAVIEEIKVVSYRYERPENTNISEDFESGSLDVNLFSSIMRSADAYPAGLFVDEYNGSKVLMYKNAGIGYFGTTHDYSNFELTFDIPYIQHKDVIEENGQIEVQKSMALVLSFGAQPAGEQWYGYETAADSIVFEGNKIYTLKSGQVKMVDLARYCNIEQNEGPSVKLTVIDTDVTLSFQLLGSEEYEEIFSYKTGIETPLGKIQFWSSGRVSAALDNIRIMNKDENANLIEIEANPYVPEGTEDWDYQPMERVYLEAEGEEEGFHWAMLIVYAVIAGAVVLAVSLIIAGMQRSAKNRKKKGEKTNEI